MDSPQAFFRHLPQGAGIAAGRRAARPRGPGRSRKPVPAWRFRAISPAPTAPACGRGWRAGCCCRWRAFPPPRPRHCIPACNKSSGAITRDARRHARGGLRHGAIGGQPFVLRRAQGEGRSWIGCRDRFGVRPSVDAERPDLRVNLYLYRDEATISLDLSGESACRRGFTARSRSRRRSGKLAAAILLRADWPAIARGGGALVDLMCDFGHAADRSRAHGRRHRTGVAATVLRNKG